MSGIFGILNCDGKPVAQDDLCKMQQVLKHRGPDWKQFWSDGEIGLGNLMMYVTPESFHEKMPYEDSESGLTITADARLDNREELFHLLSVPYPQRSGIPDSLLILKSYQKWGDDCPVYLLGDFAFSIWDRYHKRLFCARDHFGIRPFFYYFKSNQFIFASEIKGIRTLPYISVGLNEQAVVEELLPIPKESGRIFFKDIYRLKCAHILIVQGREIRSQSYWLPDVKKETRYSSDNEYAEALRELLKKTITSRLRSNFPVGITLSGGLDSSTIACIAARELKTQGKMLHAFSSVLPENHVGIETDERKYIQAVLDQEPNIKVNYIDAQGISPFDNLDSQFEKFEIPAAPFHFVYNSILHSAAQSGVRTLFTGLGGDHMVSTQAPDSLFRLYKELRWISLFKLAHRISVIEKTSIEEVLRQKLIYQIVPNWLGNRYHYFKQNRKHEFVPHSPVNLDFAKKYGIKPFMLAGYVKQGDRRISLVMDKIKRGKNGIEKLMMIQAYAGMSGRFPLFDKRIIEFFMEIPPEQYWAEGMNRSIFRRAARGYLPPIIQNRKDKGSSWPAFHKSVLSRKKEMIQFLNSIPENDWVREYIDIDRILKLYDQVKPVKGRDNWETRTQRIVVKGIILIKYLHWIKNA